MKKTMLTLLLLLPFALTSAFTHADSDKSNGKSHQNSNQKSHGKDKKNNKGSGHDSNLLSVTITFDQARGLAVTHGLTGYSTLPPGITKSLVRGKPLPPGIAKKVVPVSMLNSLPHYPGYEWYIAGDDLVLVAVATAVVNTVLSGVFN